MARVSNVVQSVETEPPYEQADVVSLRGITAELFGTMVFRMGTSQGNGGTVVGIPFDGGDTEFLS